MGLLERCTRNFNSHDLGRGREYYLDGSVEILAGRKTSLRALVEGSSTYDVQLDWSDATAGWLFAYCSCPRFAETGKCKHLVATIMAADGAGIGQRVPGRGSLDIESDGDEWTSEQSEDDFESVEPQRGAAAKPTERLPAKTAAGNGRSKKPQPPLWRKQLELVSQLQVRERAEQSDPRHQPEAKAREIWYVLNFAASQRRHQPVVSLWQRETKKDGTLGKLKQATFLPDEISRIHAAEDRALIGLLVGNERGLDYEYSSYGYGYQQRKLSEFVIAPPLFDVIFPRLCASGRFGWLEDEGQGPDRQVRLLAWDDGPPWRPVLSVARAGDQRMWLVEGKLVREDQVAELGAARLFLDVGLVVFDDRMVRFQSGGAMPWLTMVRQMGPMQVPVQQEQELVESLAKSPEAVKIELPEELRWEEERPQPLPHLTITKPKKSWSNDLECQLVFRYGSYSAAPQCGGDAWYDRDRRRLVRRDLPAERAAMEQLTADGGCSVARYGYDEPARLLLTPARLPALAQRMTSLGWRVEAEGRLIRRSGSVSLGVTSGVDWFDLEGVCDFDGVSAPLPDVLAALRKGERFVTLGDGSKGMLPEDWLRRFGGLADLGESKGSRIRFAPSQASLLDALLSAQDSQHVAVDQAFDRLRAKLSSFQGIGPRVEPKSFAGTLRAYQREGLGWLNFLDEFGFGGCLADDMGLGKTIQVLALLEGRRLARRRSKNAEQEDLGPSLVIVPRSLVFNWLEEARRFAPQLRVLNYTGLDREAALERLNECDLVVTTYGTLRRDIARLGQQQFDFLILDEAQAIKNAASQSAKCCRLLPARRRLAMTGTPVENHLGELWSLFEFLNPGMLGRNAKLTQMLSRHRGNKSNGTAQPDGEPAEELSLLVRALRPFMLRRTKQQVLSELPEKTEQTLYCELAERERKLYEELRDRYRSTLLARVDKQGMNKSKIHVLEALLRLRQAACHPGLLDKSASECGSAKLDALLEQVAEVTDEGHKALVFSQFTSLLAIVRRQLDERKVVYEYLDGKTVDRQKRVERFQNDPACQLFLISLKAGGQGLNLTAADYVFILDPWWNPAVEAQAVDRAHRLGQTRPVFAYRLIARDTVEEKILELQRHKRELAEAIVSADSGLLRNLTQEDLNILLS